MIIEEIDFIVLYLHILYFVFDFVLDLVSMTYHLIVVDGGVGILKISI